MTPQERDELHNAVKSALLEVLQDATIFGEFTHTQQHLWVLDKIKDERQSALRWAALRLDTAKQTIGALIIAFILWLLGHLSLENLWKH